MNKQKSRELVNKIMQSGFDVAMGGDPFKSEKENKEWLEKEYDRVVEKYTQALSQREAEVREEIIEKLEKMRKWEDPDVRGQEVNNYKHDEVLRPLIENNMLDQAIKAIK